MEEVEGSKEVGEGGVHGPDSEKCSSFINMSEGLTHAKIVHRNKLHEDREGGGDRAIVRNAETC